MVGESGEDGVGSIDLFEGNDESKFVLESQRAERPEQVRAFDNSWGESVCATDEKGTRFAWIGLDFPYFLGKRAAGQVFARFVQDQAKATFAPVEQLGALARRVRRLNVGSLNSAEAAESSQVFGDASTGVGQARLANCDDTPAQG
jgi:hypothetical protein